MIPQPLLLLLCLCHPPSKVLVKARGVSKILSGRSSYSWLSKSEVTALSASNNFPLALLIMIIQCQYLRCQYSARAEKGGIWPLSTTWDIRFSPALQRSCFMLITKLLGMQGITIAKGDFCVGGTV